MEKRIFIPLETVTLAHVVRPLQIAKALRTQGAEVIFGMNERFRNLIEEEGFEVRPLFCAEHKILLDAVRTLNFKKQIQALPLYLESDLEVIEEIGNIDLILSDFRFTIRLAAEYLNIPHVALVNGFFSPHYAIIPELPEILASKMPRWLSRNISLRKFLKHSIERYHAGPYQKLCRDHGIPTQIHRGFDFAVSSTLTLVCDLPEFTPQDKDLPPHYQFIGPVMWEPEGNAENYPSYFSHPLRPLIYATLGSSGAHDMLERMVEIFRGSEYNLVISTSEGKMERPAPNIIVKPFVAPSQVLKHAALMICHGGNGSVYQAIQNAVPTLCFTTFYDQEWNGQRVRELGLGDSMFLGHFKLKSLFPTIERLIHGAQIKLNLRQYQNQMSKWNAPHLACEKIGTLLRAGAIP